MRADLDELFAAMGAHADLSATGTPEGARRRGEQRRRNRITAASLALVLLISVVAVGGIRIARDAILPTQPSPQPTGSVATLSPVGSLPMPLGPPGQGDGGGYAVVVGDRAYLVGYTASGGVKVGSMDLATGEPVFATVDLPVGISAGVFWASPQGLALHVGRDGEAGGALVVVDPDTGAIRWQTDTEGPLAFYDSVLVTFSPSESVVRARDWMTGEEKWQAPYAGDYPIYLQPSADPLTGGLRLVGGGGLTFDPADHRLLRADADGTVHVVDARTGAELAVREGVGDLAPNETANLAYGGTLYRFDQETPARVIRHDLDRVESPTEVYSSSTERIENLAPCGSGRLCLLVSVLRGSRELIVVDEASQRELWRAPVSDSVTALTSIQSVPDRILVGSGDLFDLDGHQLSVGQGRSLHVLLTADSALTFELGQNPVASPVAIGIMSTVDGSTRRLGQIPPLAGYCDWNLRVLVCPATDGFHAWKLAAR